jgi:hypothetical protein
MGFFKPIEGEAAVLVHNGMYKQCELYERDNYLYAKIGNGFVRLFHDGSTTKAKMRLEHMTWTGQLYRDSLGRLAAKNAPGLRCLDADKATALIGA